MDEILVELRKKADQKKRTQNVLNELKEQRTALTEKLILLETKLNKELDDVERLEHISFESIFLRIIGKMDDELSLEKKEAEIASLKYDMCNSELAAMKNEITELEKQIKDFGDCEEQYEQLMKEKEKHIRESGSKYAHELFHLEEAIEDYESLKIELIEAIEKGEEVITSTDCLIDEIDRAICPSYNRNRIASNIDRHIHIEGSKVELEQIKIQLIKFKAELIDVNIRCDVQINIDGALLIFDKLFSGLFTYELVAAVLMQARKNTLEFKSDINKAISKMRSKLEDVDRAMIHIKRKYKERVYEANI